MDENIATQRLTQPEDRLQQLGSAGADESGQPDDLAGADLYRYGLGRAVHLQLADVHDRVATIIGDLREEILQLATDHGGDDVIVGQVRDGGIGHQIAVAEHNNAVRKLADLFHLVRGEQQGDALVPQHAHHID